MFRMSVAFTKHKLSDWKKRFLKWPLLIKDTNIPPKIPEVLRSHQEKKNFLHCVPAFKQIRI